MDVSLHYAPLEVIEVAIEKANSLKPDDLLKSVKAVKFESVIGPISFEPTKGYNKLFKQIAVQYIDGKYYIIFPKKFATHKHVYPSPTP